MNNRLSIQLLKSPDLAELIQYEFVFYFPSFFEMSFQQPTSKGHRKLWVQSLV